MTSAFASCPQALPPVPPEIWLRIFDLATDLEALISYRGASDLPRQVIKQQEFQRLKDSLRTKCSIALVCKSWNELALEFLYQSILITKMDTLLSLHTSLQRRNLPGWWTKRLDILIEDEICESSDYGMLASVIRQLPNLSIVTLSMPLLLLNDCLCRQLPTSIITSLAETCGSSLEVFDCSESILQPCREDLMMLLTASPNLKVLRCPICVSLPADKASKNPLDVPVMSKLESITLMPVFLRDYLPHDKDANHLPALRHLTCVSSPSDHIWKNFVKLTCSNLTSVTLDFRLPADCLQSELDLLSEHCPVLDRLVIHLRSWLELSPHLVLPPVSYLGLHSEASKGPVFHPQALVSALLTLTSPKLKTVRLLHADAAEALDECTSSLTAKERASLASRSFSLEDSEGRVVFVKEPNFVRIL